MAGAPEVMQLNQNLMRIINAKRVIDVGKKNKFILKVIWEEKFQFS